MRLAIHAQRALEGQKDLNQRNGFYSPCHDIVKRILGFAGCSLTRYFRNKGALLRIRAFRPASIHKPHKIFCKHMLKQKMEGMSVILMTQMTKFMQQDIVLKDLRKTYYIEIQIDIAFGRTAAPICRIVLYRDTVIDETMP